MIVSSFMLGAVAVAVITHPIWGKKEEDNSPPATTDPHATFSRKSLLPRSKNFYDIVVVGSGIGGLLVAALMARLQRKKVLVLEQHTNVGGCMHRFRIGDHVFESGGGVHYVGKLDAEMQALLHAAAPNATWPPAQGTCYDQVGVAGRITAHLRTGRRKWIGTVMSKARGREERQAALAAIRELERAAEAARWGALLKVVPHCLGRTTWRLLRLVERFTGWRLAPYYHRHTFNQAVAGAPEACKKVMVAQSGNLGTGPGEAPAAMHAAMVKHFWGGAHVPDLDLLVKDMTATIAAAGGQVVTNAMVQSITVVRGRACGVLVGQPNSSCFVSVGAREAVVVATGLANTVKLLGEDAPRSLQRIVRDVVGRPSVCHVHLFVGLDGPLSEPLSAANVWHHADEEDWLEAQHEHLNATTTEAFAVGEAPPSPVFISSAAAKRGEQHAAHPTVVVIAEANPEWFTGRQTSHDYRALKDRIRGRLLGVLYSYYPQCRGRVQVAKVGTPLSSLDFIGTRESHGLSMRAGPRFGNPAVAMALRPKTPIPGLFISGQDVVANGLAGAMAGAALCTHVLGRYGVPSCLGTGLVNAAQRTERA